jgi:predicted enzyme related to lactoylglutathione lyase
VDDRWTLTEEMTMSETPLGRPCWYELMTTDPEGAPDFYKRVAGWTTDAFEGGDQPYTMWVAGETPIGGVMELPEEAAQAGAPSHWLMYVSTPDIVATADKVRELGGSILTELDIPTVGKILIVQDPQGAVFSAYQPADETPGHDNPPGLSEFSWHELATTDWEAAWAFYSELFGWEQTEQMDMGEMGIYQMFGRGAHPLGGMFNKPAEMPVSAWMLYVRVPDVNAAAETVKELGGQVLNGPMEVPGGDTVAQCMDPAGAAFAVHSVGQSQS